MLAAIGRREVVARERARTVKVVAEEGRPRERVVLEVPLRVAQARGIAEVAVATRDRVAKELCQSNAVPPSPTATTGAPTGIDQILASRFEPMRAARAEWSGVQSIPSRRVGGANGSDSNEFSASSSIDRSMAPSWSLFCASVRLYICVSIGRACVSVDAAQRVIDRDVGGLLRRSMIMAAYRPRGTSIKYCSEGLRFEAMV